MELFLQILAAVSVILFLVAVSMSYKTWRIHTIVLMVMVFMASGVMFWLAVQVLKTNQAWRELHAKLMAEALAVEKEVDEVRNGVKNDEGEVEEPGIVQLKQQIRAVLYDRGRVWTDCTPLGVNGGSVQVRVDSPTPHQIADGTVIFAFDAKPVHQRGSYLGEFKVAGAAAGAPADAAAAAAPAGPITLQNNWPMSPGEQQRLQAAAGPNAKWILCDKMPADGHFIFADLDACTAEELGVTPAEMSNLTRDDRLARFLPIDRVPETVREEFRKDGQPAEAEDPDERKEVLVKFDENHASGDFEYKRRQEVWLPKLSEGNERGADDLAAQEIVEIVEDQPPRYARELNDYAYIFRDIYLNAGQRVVRMGTIEFDTGAVNLLVGDQQGIITGYEEEQARLTEDKNGFTRDLTTISNLLSQVLAQRDALARQMFQLRAENKMMAKQIDDLQMRSVQAINARNLSPQASVGVPGPVAAVRP